MTKQQAKELSIKKWEWIVDHQGDSDGQLDSMPELIPLLHECGYCEKYFYTKSDELLLCAKCPIRPGISEYNETGDSGCAQEKHPYMKWCRANGAKKLHYAKQLLELIKQS